MDIGLAESVIATKTDATRQIAQFKIMKTQHDMEASLINMLTDVAKNAPVPEGTGQNVDKTA